MYTYQDLMGIGESEQSRIKFIKEVIAEHKVSEAYQTAKIADQYNKHKNVTINQYKKWLYTVTGEKKEDIISANYKLSCRHFHRFITQEVQFLLGNGTTWENHTTANKMGNDKYPFDNQLIKLAKKALIMGVSFGFWNFDHVEIFDLLHFAPLYDEINGSLSAGVRFWQVSSDKPLRATLYEMDGYTEYIWNKPDDDKAIGEVFKEKTNYVLNIRTSKVDGTEIYDGHNYPTFPIVPLYANEEHQSELVGLREQIDCYDLIKSGFANTVDESSMIYWIVENAGGMDDVDLAKFLDHIKTLHAATVDDDGAKVTSNSVEAPYASREALLERLNKDLYKDAMATDIDSIASGAATATEIEAAYQPLNSKCDDFEYCVLDFINAIKEINGVDDNATFNRSMIINVQEMVQTVLLAAQYLDQSYVTRKVLTILGDGDLADQMLKDMDAEDMERFMKRPQNNEEYNGPSEDEEGQEDGTENTGEAFGDN